MSEAVDQPVPTEDKKAKNKARLEELKKRKAVAKEAKASGAADQPGAEGGAKPARVRKEKVAKVPKPCRCGCGGQTTAFFVPGHDARWKGWMKKIELGKMELKDLPAPTQKMYKFTPRGVGYVPSENYNGSPYVPQCALEDVTEANTEA